MIEQRDLLYNQIIDLKFCTVLMKLRQMGLLKKEHIQRYGLLNKLCCHSYFAEHRFRFLVEGDPNALTQTDEDGRLPLHYVAQNTSIQGFNIVFEYGILYYPKKKGISILFKKDNDGDTPFQLACERFGYDEVMKIVDDTLTLHSDTTTPINVEDALITAAIDENIHLDCVYFLLQRQPDVLVKLLLSQSVAASSINDNNNKNRYENENGILMVRIVVDNKRLR
jgi:ankyrin repeat protein